MLLYKPIATTIRRSGFMPKKRVKATPVQTMQEGAPVKDDGMQTKADATKESFVFNKGTVLVLVIAVLTLVLAGVILYLLNAEFKVF